ncbi:hypothetical protein PIB30_060992 [Stylosanthes scabra]|uniref:Uncharacterized protein n=1 Tax=Stylosanthes scabra TaxID=79078 RepID=A0ABU6YLF0_9FABA|nr:hypothetical protein [Stylosanthes scabra]
MWNQRYPTLSLPRISTRYGESWLITLIPTETGVPPQFQPDIAEFVRKGFEDMRLMMTEGFARLSDRIDRLDTHMTSQDTDLRNLWDEFHSFHDEMMYVYFQEQPEDNQMQD